VRVQPTRTGDTASKKKKNTSRVSEPANKDGIPSHLLKVFADAGILGVCKRTSLACLTCSLAIEFARYVGGV